MNSRIFSRGIFLTGTLTILSSVALMFAHGGFEHVGGTVVKLENSVLTVKTTHGNVAVRVDAKTEITQNGKAAQAADLKAGVKVVVDVPEDGKESKAAKEKVAHAIKIGAAAAADAHEHEHDSHK